MKKIICSIVLALSLLSMYAQSIHFKFGYIISRCEGEISKIRIQDSDGKFHDLYCYENNGKIYGYNGGDDSQVEFIIDTLIDISIED